MDKWHKTTKMLSCFQHGTVTKSLKAAARNPGVCDQTVTYGIAPQSDGYFHDQISTGAYYFSWLSKNLSFISKTVLSEWDMQSILPSLAPYIKRDSDSWELASKEILSKHGFFFFLNWYFLLWKEPVQLTNIIPFLCGK